MSSTINPRNLSITELLEVPCKKLRELPEAEIEYIAKRVVDHYYNIGFPYYPIDPEKIAKEYHSLKAYDISKLAIHSENGHTFDELHLQQVMLGLNTVNSFHPEMWSVHCGNAASPMDVFNSRDMFTTAIRKRIMYSDTPLAPYNIRKSLKAFGVQAVSNFRPTIAKYLFERLCPAGGSVLDPCMGYGGRLFGATASHIGEYFGIDPNYEAIRGNLRLVDHLRLITDELPQIWTLQAPFEDTNLTPETFDLVATSPPYFNKEKYSNDDTQSWVRYPKYDQWVEGFLRPLFEKSYAALKPNGYMALNVGNRIEVDTIRIGSEVFGGLNGMCYMRLSKMLGQGDKGKVSHKVEPIYIWKKF